MPAAATGKAAISQSEKDARQLLREARGLLSRYASRLKDGAFHELDGAIDALEKTLPRRDADANVTASQALDRKLDEYVSFGRKSTTRQYIESISGAVFFALLLRAFVLEPFKIPSGSMIPTLQVGDHIFVNKFIYGIRVPFTDIKFGTSFRRPKRGEVIVFKYPRDPDKDFIKRIVAVEGDVIEGRDNQLFVNGVGVPRSHIDGDCMYDDFDEQSEQWTRRACDPWQETVNGVDYTTYLVAAAGCARSRRAPCRPIRSFAWATTATTRTTHARGASFPTSSSRARRS